MTTQETQKELSWLIENQAEGCADTLAHATDTELHPKKGRLARTVFTATIGTLILGGILPFVIGVWSLIPIISMFSVFFVIYWNADI